MLIRCPNHLNCLFSILRSSGFTLSPSRMTPLPISTGEPSHSLKETNFCCCICTISLFWALPKARDSRKVRVGYTDWLVNWELPFYTRLPLWHDRQCLYKCRRFHRSISVSHSPLTCKHNPEINSSTSGSNSSLTRTEHFTLLLLRTMAFDFEVRILIPANSHWESL